MAALLDLDTTKLHLRVTHDDEDTLITALIATATAAAADYLNMPIESVDSTVPSPIKSAALLLIGSLYNDRESQGDRPYNKNPTFEMLLQPYKVYE